MQVPVIKWEERDTKTPNIFDELIGLFLNSNAVLYVLVHYQYDLIRKINFERDKNDRSTA